MIVNERSALPVRLLLAAVLLAPAGSVLAQQLPQEEEEAVELEAIQTTGSRIRRVYTEGDSPVYTLSREDLERTGESNIADVLQQLTTGGSALNTRLNSSGNFGFPPSGAGVGAGAATVNLRHLGAQRTLILVNGIRWVNESSASGVSSIVDLNTIPLAAVERIEILEDGASAVYGTDAIGGVVNIILRDQMDGGEVLTYFGQFDEGDGERIRAEGTIGGNFEKLSFILNGSYNNDRRIRAADREISRFPVPGTGVTRGSSGTPNSRTIFFPDQPNEICPLADTDGDDVPDTPICDVTTPNGSSFPDVADFPEDFIPFTNENRFNFSPFNLLATPNERTSVYAQLNYAFRDNVSFYFRGMFNERNSVNQAAPEPIFLGPSAGTGNPFADNITISGDNPFNPFGIDLVSGENFELLGRRPIEAGPRIFKQDVDTRYLALGSEGNFSIRDHVFFWDVNLVDAESEAFQTDQGSFNIRRINDALGPPERCAEIPGCVPLDLFNGPGTLTQEMIDFIGALFQNTSEQDLELVSFNITGDVVELPAGTVGIAAGYEHRELDGFFQPDSIIVAGESNGVPALPTSGGFNVEEVYGELSVPVLADVPGVHRLDLNGAIRLSDFSTSGSSTTVKAGFRWEVTEDLLVRGSFAEGIRAPGIGELFGSASRFDAVLDDPCSNFLNSGVSQTVIDNCQALGVPASFVQANQQISVTTGGNPNLDPETSDSWSAGLIYSPGWVDSINGIAQLDFGVTWYRHELEDAIQAIDAQDQLDACLNDLNSGFCEGIDRAVTGAINNFQNRLQNIGGINTSGFDFSLNYASPDTSFGRFSLHWKTTFVDNFSELTNDPVDPDAPALVTKLVGIEEDDSAIAEWQSNMIIAWALGNWETSFTLRYIDNVVESCSDFLDGTPNSLTNLGLCSRPNFEDNTQSLNSLESRIYTDFQAGYTLDFNGETSVTLTAGVQNLFDKAPPRCVSCSLNGFDVTTHELPGQFWYVRSVLRF